MAVGVLSLIRRLIGADTDTHVPDGVLARFELRYNDLIVGTLLASAGKWTFRYSDEFRSHRELRPLVEFPDVQVEYESECLWPFFLMRIPGMKQASVRDCVRTEDIDANDAIKLLERFGRQTISNPFDLVKIAD